MKKTIVALAATCALSVVPVTAFASTSSSASPHQTAATAHQTTVLPYPGYPLHYGSQGKYVKEVQQRLNELPNNNAGQADGIFGPKTEIAVEEFQTSKGLTVDGIVGPKTWNALFNSGTSASTTHGGFHHPAQWNENSILRQGDSGIEVKNLQYIVNVLQFYTKTSIVNVDGIFGPQTKQAIITYQKAHGLSADGIVGPQTWASFSHYIEKKSSSTYGAGGYMGLRIEWKYNNTSDTSSCTAYVYGDGTQLSDTYTLTAH